MSVKQFIKHFCLAVCGVAALASCNKDSVDAPVTGGDGSALVKLSIYTPSSSVPKAARSSADADECTVQEVKLVVLQKSGANYRYRYMVDGQQITQSASDSQVTTFNALLESSDVPVKILLVANYNDVFVDGVLAADMDESTVKSYLTDNFDHRIDGNIPLYGEIELGSLKADQPNTITVTMLREVARVDVNTTLNASSGPFRIDEVFIYRANDQISVVPAPSAMNTEGKMTVSAATVPATAGQYAAYSKKAVEGETSVVKTYLPESLPVEDASARLASATCVVVGGFYGDDTKPSYYRIDFDSGYDGHPFGQVLRNHKYIFNIVQVNGSGWETPGEAAENEATAIVATMQVWDELTSEMWFYGNANYLGISSRRVVLSYFAGSEKTETLQATVPFSVQLLDSAGNPTGNILTPDGGTLTGEFYTLSIEKDPSQGDDVWSLVITSLKDNYDEELDAGFVVFTDWWTFNVEVVQESYIDEMASKYVNVLTITDLDGDLGTADGTFTAVSGQAMRMVLENRANFSPDGIVPIGGIVVFDLRNETVSSSSPYDMYILEKVLTQVQVVHLPGGCTLSSAAAALIQKWHMDKPNRIIIVGMDDQQTNSALRPYLYTLEDADQSSGRGTWMDNTTATALDTPMEPDWQERDGRFFDGPFGTVTFGEMGLSKDHVGYNNGYNDETTVPILRIARGQDNEDMLTHGINLVNGIFYCGDSGITSNRGNAMSNAAHTTGVVDKDFDILMANIWAWIVERAAMVSENV